jgi:hypothetical protein
MGEGSGDKEGIALSDIVFLGAGIMIWGCGKKI